MRLVAIGDSITYGFPFSPQMSWVAGAAALLKITIINQGVCGDTTSGMLHRFASAVLGHKPDGVILMGGSNDAFEWIHADTIVDNLISMVEAALHHDIRPMIGLPIPCVYPQEEQRLQTCRQLLRDYAANKQVTVIDFYSAMLDQNGSINLDLYVEGVHPNEQGYQIMTACAVQCLSSKERGLV